MVGVTADDIFVTVVIEERQALIGTSRLMMMFGAKDLQLKQWTVTDPQGYDTTVAVSNLDTSQAARSEPVQDRLHPLRTLRRHSATSHLLELDRARSIDSSGEDAPTRMIYYALTRR